MDRAQLATVIFPMTEKRRTECHCTSGGPGICSAAERGRGTAGKLFLLVLEAALLIEEHYDEICDELWYIYCEKEVRMERLRHNRGYSDKKIEQMLKNQLSDEEFESKCDFQLYNSEDVAHTYLQIERKMRTYYESM